MPESAPDPAAFQQAFGAWLAGRSTPPADAALARALTIHRNTAAKAAQDALAANFPVVRTLVGEEPFAACARAFVEAAPPATPRLCDYGLGFADFLEGWAPFAEAPYLPDLAELERAVVEALFAADAPALEGAALAAGLDPDARLALHPAARRLDSGWPVAALWRAHQDDAPQDALETLEWRREAALVSRPEGEVGVIALDPAAAAFADAAAEGATLAEAAAAAAEQGDVAAAFSTLLLAGALVAAD